MTEKMTYLNDIQKEYYKMLKSKENLVSSDDLSLIEIAKIVEEVDIFWRRNRDKVLFDLDYFNDKETLFLAGSMYLDIEDNKHYYFKTFGEENIVNEPMLKFQYLLNQRAQDNLGIISIFKRSFKNTLNLLENYSSYFYILPLDYIISVYNDELIKLQNKLFYKLLASILDCGEILSPDSFIEKFNSIEVIESILIDKDFDLFEFDKEDKNLTLKEKIDKHENLIPIQSDDYIIKFLCLLYNFWNQAIHIGFTFLELGFIPYITFNTAFLTFHKLFLSLYTKDDANEILNKIIIFYTFKICTDESIFNEINFEEYVDLVKECNFQEKLMNDNREYISKGLTALISHISKEVSALLEKFNN